MNFNNSFKIVLVLTLICHSSTIFAMKRKPEEKKISSNKIIKKAFDCACIDEECKAKKYNGYLTSINKTHCNSNKKTGFTREIDLHTHILNFHRTCPFCPQRENITQMSTDELIDHTQKEHPNKASILYNCTQCGDYIALTLNKKNCAQQHAKNCPRFKTDQSSIIDAFNTHAQNRHTQNITHYNIYQHPQSQIPDFSEIHSKSILPSNNTTQFYPIYQQNLGEVAVLDESFQFQDLTAVLNNNNNGSTDITILTFQGFDDFKNDINKIGMTQNNNDLYAHVEDENQNNETTPIPAELELFNNFESNIPQLFDEIDEEFSLDKININKTTIAQVELSDKRQPKIHRISKASKNSTKKNTENSPKIKKKLVCLECQKELGRKQNLYSHMLNIHRLCPWCTEFKEPQRCLVLKEHYDSKHFSIADKQKELLMCRWCEDYIVTKCSSTNFKWHESKCKKNPSNAEKINAKKTNKAAISTKPEAEVFDNALDPNLSETLLTNPSCNRCNPSHQEEENDNTIQYLIDEETCPNCGLIK